MVKELDMAGSSEEPQQENLRVRGKVAVDAPEVAARVPRCRRLESCAESRSWKMLDGPETKEHMGKLKPTPMWKGQSMPRPMPGKKAQSTKDCTGSVTSG